MGIITSGKCQFNILKYTQLEQNSVGQLKYIYDVQIIHSTYPWIWFIFMLFHLILFYFIS